jgi:hypothetical protein
MALLHRTIFFVGANRMTSLVEAQKLHGEEFVSMIKTQSKLSPNSPQLAAFVFDNFVTGMNGLCRVIKITSQL